MCKKLPNNALADIEKLIEDISKCNNVILEDINEIVMQLDIILKSENLIS